MYYIKKPDTVNLVDLNTNKPLKHIMPDKTLEQVTCSFHDFLVGSILKSPVFGKNAMTVMHAITIKEKVAKTECGDYLELDDEAYTLLKEAFSSDLPITFDMSIVMQLKEFFTCVLEATKINPKETSAQKKTKKK